MFKISPKASPRGPAFGEKRTSRSELQVDALESELVKQTSNSKPAKIRPRQDLEELPTSTHQVIPSNPFEQKISDQHPSLQQRLKNIVPQPDQNE